MELLKQINEDIETIERYIQFTIDNGYSKYESDKVEDIRITESDNVCIYWKFNKNWEREFYFSQNYIQLITSKPFIEAVARGQYNNDKWEVIFDYIKDTLIENITTKQAIAIRDEKLEEFIINLLGLWSQ